jgi:hypothetical protein
VYEIQRVSYVSRRSGYIAYALTDPLVVLMESLVPDMMEIHIYSDDQLGKMDGHVTAIDGIDVDTIFLKG